jgi:hypothetical protein
MLQKLRKKLKLSGKLPRHNLEAVADMRQKEGKSKI